MEKSSSELSASLPKFVVLVVVVGLVMYALHACANDMKIVHHSFEFGMLDPNKDIEVLDYRYGTSKESIAQADKEYLTTGHIPQADNTGTFSPPGDTLYVKWRVQSTGKVYKDTVDLKTRLPSDINNKTIHFSIIGTQLYIYVIEYVQEAHAPDAPDCPASAYNTCKCTRIYPDYWKNF